MGIRGEKSIKDMASSRNLVSTIGAQASPTMVGRNQVLFNEVIILEILVYASSIVCRIFSRKKLHTYWARDFHLTRRIHFELVSTI